jgi:hypothetical protein
MPVNPPERFDEGALVLNNDVGATSAKREKK